MKTELKEKRTIIVFLCLSVLVAVIFSVLNFCVIQKLSSREISSETPAEEMPLYNEDGYKYFILLHDDGTQTVSLSGYEGNAAELYIPSEIDGYTVTEIDYTCFVYCKTLEKVVVPDSVQFIGDVAFGSCENLRDITIPYTVNEMGINLFADTSPDLIIRCQKDSCAYNYAVENGYNFEIFD